MGQRQLLTEGSGLAIITVHIMANSGLTIYSIRNRHGKPWTQILAPTASSIIGVVVIVISIYFTITSYMGDPTASNLAYLISTAVTIAWILGAGFLVTLFYARKRPNTLINAGEYDATLQ